MLTMETKSQSPPANSLQTNPANAGRNSSDLASNSMPSQIPNQALAMPIVGSQSQGRQQLLSQNMQNNISAAGVQNSASLTSTIPAVNNLTQGSIANSVGQNSNLQNMQNNSNVVQNPVGNSMGQGLASNIYAGSQRQMQGRQQQVLPQQQQQQPQIQAHLLYQQQFQQQFMKQKLQSGAIAQPMLQSHAQKQQQNLQNLIQTAQIQSSQQYVMQPNMIQSASHSGLQQNHQSSALQTSQQMLEQQPQPVLRQHHQQQTQQVLHQQQTSMSQAAPQQPLQSSTGGRIQQNQLIRQQNNIQDLQQHLQQQQQHRLMGQQNNIANLQQQQLINQQNNVPNMHQPQLGGGISGHQQSAVLGMQSITGSGMPSNQQSVHMLQQKVPVQQQMQHNVSLLQSQTQPSQGQPSQHQMVSQIQPQSGQMQHLQQHTNSLQRDMQQRLPTSGSLLQQQNNLEHQKQFFQSQRAMHEASSTSLDSTAQTGNTGAGGAGDWQEEVYQKIKSMKDMYLPEMNDMYVKIATKLQQHETLPQQPTNEQFEKLKFFKLMLERFIQFVRLTKNDIQISHKERFSTIEKQILTILQSNKPRELQPGQLPQPHMPGMQNSQPQSQITHMQNAQPQSQISHMQTHENQMNPLMQPKNMQTSAATMTQNNLNALHHNTSSVTSILNSHQNMLNSVQPSSNSDFGQSSSLLVNSLQQNNTLGGPQPVNLVGSLSSQTGVNTLHLNHNSLQTNASMHQNQHLKQLEQQVLKCQQLTHLKQLEQQVLQCQQLTRHLQQMQMQHQLLNSQQQPQQKSQPQQQQMSAQLSGQTMSPLQQLMIMRQQVKPGTPFSIPSSQVASRQVKQQPSPQIDQQNLVSLTETGTPFHAASSPFIIPSPSTHLAPSPMHGESEKVNSIISPLPNTTGIGYLQALNAAGSGQSLAIGTPGITGSPLLAEFTSLDGVHGKSSTVMSGRSNTVERHIERLIKAVIVVFLFFVFFFLFSCLL